MKNIPKHIIEILKKIKFLIKTNNTNRKGIKTNEKYIVFESDDWGSIRTSSIESYKNMLNYGDPIDKDPFTKYDSLANINDLKSLFSVLSSYTDSTGKTPIFTINCSMANPDFKKIRDSNYQQYYNETFTKTLKTYYPDDDVFKLWKFGIEEGFIFPQLHCREHLNVENWMKDLNSNDKMLKLAFDNNMISGGSSFTKHNRFAYMDAFGTPIAYSPNKLEKTITDAVTIFEQIFGFSSISFVPCCHVWNENFEKVLSNHNIKFIQGANHQLIPIKGKKNKYKKKNNFLGKKTKFGQIHLIRNCSFEPAIHKKSDVVERCIKQIEIAFKHKKPAVINSHRLNYIGNIHPENRDKNLKELAKLLEKILERWPDVEFLSTVQLTDKIFN